MNAMNIIMLVLAILGFLLSLITSMVVVAFMQGKFAQFKEDMARRVGALERADGHAITREEMDARFTAMQATIEALRDRFGDFVDIIKERLVQ